MTAGVSLAAVAFYLGLASGVAGVILIARGAVERRPRPRVAVPLLWLGLAAVAASLAWYARGPRDMLPF